MALDPISNIASAVTGVLDRLKADPTVKLQLQSQLQEDELKSRISLELAQIASDQSALTNVNQTMQAEDKSNSIIKDWRDGVGWAFAFYILQFVLIPFFPPKWGLHIVEMSQYMTVAILAVLGVTAYHQGQADLATAKNGNGK